jgi:ABC-type lipoprotein release transport system permease subunit
MGGVIGAIKGTTISLVLYWVINSYFPPFQDELGESMVGQELGRLFSLMEDFNLL